MSSDSEGEEEEAEESPVPGSIRDAILYNGGGQANFEYPVGYLKIQEGEVIVVFQVAAITVVQDKVLVAFPHTAWHRTVDRRVLPVGAVTKAAALAVRACGVESRAEPTEAINIKTWVGYLSKRFEDKVEYFGVGEEPEADIRFLTENGENGYLPWAEALVAVADERFAFASALSQESATEAGFSKLEAGLGDIRKILDRLSGSAGAIQEDRHKATKAPSAKPKTKTTAAASKRWPGSGTGGGLDPEVAAAARGAGVPESHLKEMEKLIGLQRAGLEEPRGGGLDLVARPPEAEDELGEPLDEPAAQDLSSDPMTAALTKLTTIVDQLAARKIKKNSLEELLDDAGGSIGGDTSSGTGGGRRNAAVLKALRKALVENPNEIYKVIFQNMVDDFGSRPTAPGAGEPGASFRGWLEHRSRIPNIQGTVRVAWSAAGALDALEANRIEEGKARLALLLAQLDQVADDRGQWLIAAEAGLEVNSPPFASFGKHLLPDSNENQFSRLLDSRWIEAFTRRVKEVESYTEQRSR